MSVGQGETFTHGYEHYLQPAGQVPASLERVTIAFDTNALLNLYRQHISSTQSVLKDLKRLAHQLFLPAQVRHEFWLNRDAVLRNIQINSSTQTLADAKRSTVRVLDIAKQFDIENEEYVKLKALVETTFTQIKQSTTGKLTTQRAFQALKYPASDEIVVALQDLFDGRSGPDYDSLQLSELRAEADERFAKYMPPGYMDREKPNGGYGDYLLWSQLLRQGKESGLPVLLVTDDRKEDWWRIQSDKTLINARFELVREMRELAGVEFSLITLENFVAQLAAQPASEIVESAVDDEGLIDEASDVDDSLLWTRAEFNEFVQRVAEWGYERQHQVISAALGAPEGVLARSDVLGLLGLPNDSKLTGFTKPIRTVQSALVREGLIREGLSWAFAAQYDGPGKARRFAVPEEIALRPMVA